jgi:hypothetical protein
MTQATRRLDLVLLIGVSIALVASGVAGFVGQRQAAHQQACLTYYANEMADALESRTTPAVDRDRAEQRFYSALNRLAKGQDARVEAERALQALVEADAKLQRERQANPYPAPPREVCPRG